MQYDLDLRNKETTFASVFHGIRFKVERLFVVRQVIFFCACWFLNIKTITVR